MESYITLPPRFRRLQRQSLLLLQLFVSLLLGGSSIVQLRIVSKVAEPPPTQNITIARFQQPRRIQTVPKERVWWSDLQATENAVIVEEMRQDYRNSTDCSDETQHRVDWFIPPRPLMNSSGEDEDPFLPSPRAVKACRFSILDLGANVGDSLGKLIDTGVGSSCTAKYNVTDGWMYTSPKPEQPSKLRQWIAKKMRDFQRTHQSRSRGATNHPAEDFSRPEQYCYFGVEGNPIFTEPLQQLQQRLLATKPRPVRSVYFYTETVATGQGDGPTTFYLDTVNQRQNFFGSSVLASHTDVRHSVQQFGRTAISRTVTGMTLSTLARQVVRWEAGAHLVIKMDIEGAEYAALNEAWDSRALCDSVASGVRIDIRVEIHPKVG
jgi:Methyltransferase FkbM domain